MAVGKEQTGSPKNEKQILFYECLLPAKAPQGFKHGVSCDPQNSLCGADSFIYDSSHRKLTKAEKPLPNHGAKVVRSSPCACALNTPGAAGPRIPGDVEETIGSNGGGCPWVVRRSLRREKGWRFP